MEGLGGDMEVGRYTGVLFCYSLSLEFFGSQETENSISQKKSRDHVYLYFPEDCLLMHLGFFKSSVVDTFAGDLNKLKTKLRVCGQAF